MSRSDFWSIAATLIVAGIGYFVGGQKSAYGCIALGAVMIIYLLLTHKESKPAGVSATANPRITANPQMTANPNMSINLHLPGSEKGEKQPLATSKPKPKHNLQLHSCKMARIEGSLGHGGMNGFHFTDDQSKPNAAVVCIKNKSKDGEVAYMHDVRAALTFRDSNGHEIGQGIPQACWVDNDLRNASFEVEESKCVILAIMQKDSAGEIIGAAAPYIREHMTEFGMVSTVDRYELEENLDTVELILISENKRAMEPMMFELFAEKGGPGIRMLSDEE